MATRNIRALDQVYNRWLLDGKFRAAMDADPVQALTGYNLTDKEWVQMSRLSRKVRLQAKANRQAGLAGKKAAVVVPVRRVPVALN
jgi:hypothetical protein